MESTESPTSMGPTRARRSLARKQRLPRSTKRTQIYYAKKEKGAPETCPYKPKLRTRVEPWLDLSRNGYFEMPPTLRSETAGPTHRTSLGGGHFDKQPLS